MDDEVILEIHFVGGEVLNMRAHLADGLNAVEHIRTAAWFGIKGMTDPTSDRYINTANVTWMQLRNRTPEEIAGPSFLRRLLDAIPPAGS